MEAVADNSVGQHSSISEDPAGDRAEANEDVVVVVTREPKGGHLVRRIAPGLGQRECCPSRCSRHVPRPLQRS